MLYILALFIPPLGVLLAGRIFSAIIIAAVWVFLLLFSFILGHIVCVVLAWILIATGVSAKRHKQLMGRR